jgi:putative aminopeptidase FrvX
VRALLVGMMKPLASSLTYDGMGSIIAIQGSGGPKIMVDAHMDELGAMVRRVTPNGLLTMQMLGGWLDQVLPDQRWGVEAWRRDYNESHPHTALGNRTPAAFAREMELEKA